MLNMSEQFHPDMHRPRFENVTFWRATRCAFAENCSKTPKHQSNSQVLVFFVKSTSGSTKICNFWYFGVSEQFLAKIFSKNRKLQTSVLPESPKLHYLTVIFGNFEQFLAKPHLVACQNRTIWTFGKNMSGSTILTSNL